MQGRLGASRIGEARITGEGEGLAAAAAPVHFAERTGTAGLGHPVGAAEALKASDPSQISRRDLSRTLSKSRPGMVSAAWQGNTLPDGVTLRLPRPQPPMHGFGRLA